MSSSGALLALQDDADRDYVLDNNDWLKYMAKNHASWHKFAKHTQKLHIEKEKIILVRGRVRARQWLLTSFVNRGEMLQLNFEGGIPYCGGGGVAFSHREEKMHSPASRQSALFGSSRRSVKRNIGRNPLRDCLFISSYQAKYRLRRTPSISAAADAKETSDDWPSDGDESSTLPRSCDESDSELEGIVLNSDGGEPTVTVSYSSRCLNLQPSS